VTTLLLVRHGLTALTGSILAGRTRGLSLDERGRAQARELGDRLRRVPLAAIVSSPLERCVETAQAIAAGREREGMPLAVETDDRLLEVDYGSWTGGEIRRLAKEPLWRVVQAHPSAAEFPGGESLRAMSARAVEAVRDANARFGPDATWLACTHGDVIKAIVADALALHLDEFQRIVADPCSLTVIRYAETRAFVVRTNDVGGPLEDLIQGRARRGARRRGDKRRDDGDVGGGSGRRV
jgi:probable phosphomutase (TIGR03848 family)